MQIFPTSASLPMLSHFWNAFFSNLTISHLYLLKLYPVQECCSHVTSFLKRPQLPSYTALLTFHSPVMTSAFSMVILQIYHPIPHYSSLVPRQHCKFKSTFNTYLHLSKGPRSLQDGMSGSQMSSVHLASARMFILFSPQSLRQVGGWLYLIPSFPL